MPMRHDAGYGIKFFTFVLFFFSSFFTFVRIRFAVAETDDSILRDGSPLRFSDNNEDNQVMGIPGDDAGISPTGMYIILVSG